MISYKTKNLIAWLNYITANYYEIKEHNWIFEIWINCNLYSHNIYDNENKAQDRIKRIIKSYLD
jgi:hypothetical protein